MRGRGALALAAALVVVAATGCKIDSTQFVPPGGDDDDDGDGGPIDAAVDGPAGPRVMVTPETTTVPEGGQVIVRVTLSAAPTSDAPITVVPTDAVRVSATPSALTFTSGNWNVERIVTLMAASDDDAADNPVTVIFTGGGVVGDGSAMVMVSDDDLMRLIVSPASTLSVTEQQTAPIQVRLSARPTGTVMVAVAAMTPGVVSLSTDTLSFDGTTWNQNQAVMVTGTNDVNTADDTTQVVFDPDVEGISSHAVLVTVTDDDILNIEATPGSLGTLIEGGVGGGFAVKLTQMPTGPVTVDLTVAPVGAVNLTQTSLAFTTANWATAQPVTASAPQDGNVVDESVTITLAATGLTSRAVTAAIDDDDTQVIELSPTSVTNLLEGTSANVDVHLRYQPGGPVVVDVASLDPALVGVDLPQLTFTTTDFGTNQVVRVGALSDPNLVGGSTSVRFNIAADGLSRDAAVSVTDDDTQAIVIDRTSIAVGEGGAGAIKAHLAFEPAGSVNVAVSSGNPTKIGASPAMLTFDANTYGDEQAVTISGLEDPDTANESGMVTLSTTGIGTRSISVSVADNDALDIVVNPTSLIVPEGSGAPLMVKLGAQPAGSVTVSIAATPAGVVGLSGTMLTFDQNTWNTNQQITVSAGQDPNTADEGTTLTLSAIGLAPKAVPVTVDDDDTVTVLATPNPLAVTEGAGGSSLQVRLSHDPGGTVIVTAAETSNGHMLDLAPGSLTFSSANWSQHQSIIVSSPPDDDLVDQVATIGLSVPGGTGASVTVNIDDRTVLIGFPPPHTGLPRTLGGQLHAFLAPTPNPTFACFKIDKLVVVTSSVAGAFPFVRISLYRQRATGSAGPGSMVWADQPRQVVLGRNEIAIGSAVSTSFPLWIAIENTGTIGFQTQAGSASHCVRAHVFGDGAPNPFDSTAIGGSSYGGSAGTAAPVTCDSDRPPAVWLIGHPEILCGGGVGL